MHEKVMCTPGLPSVAHGRYNMLSVVLNLAIYTEKKEMCMADFKVTGSNLS